MVCPHRWSHQFYANITWQTAIAPGHVIGDGAMLSSQ